MIVEHLGKDAKHCCFRLIAGAFYINIKEDGIGISRSRFFYLLLKLRHIFELFDKTLRGAFAINFHIRKQIGQHFQKVRFTTAEEPRNPYTHISRWIVVRLTIIFEERLKVFAEFIGYDILIQFLFDYIVVLLVNFNNPIYRTVDVFLKDIFYFHALLSSLII